MDISYLGAAWVGALSLLIIAIGLMMGHITHHINHEPELEVVREPECDVMEGMTYLLDNDTTILITYSMKSEQSKIYGYKVLPEYPYDTFRADKEQLCRHIVGGQGSGSAEHSENPWNRID